MTDGKIAKITDGRKNKNKSKSQPVENEAPNSSKPRMADLHHEIIQAFVRSALKSEYMPEPDVKFGAFYDEKKRKVLFGVGPDNICYDSPIEVVSNQIALYCYGKLEANRDYRLTDSSIESCARLYKKLMPVQEQPRPFLFKSDTDTLGYARLPFDLTTNEPTPHFDELFSRMSNSHAVLCFIGALLVPDAYRQQYVAIYGDGNDGKGSLLGFLFNFFGASALTQTNLPDPSNKHWAVPFANKRLVIYPDLEAHNGLRSAIFKSLISDDPVFIDPKGEPGYSVRLNCMNIMGLNGMPNISSAASDTRRMIFAEMTPAPRFDSKYADMLWAEGGAFMGKCKELYENCYPNRGPIKSDQESKETIEGWTSTLDEGFQVFFDRHFKLDANRYVLPAAMQERLEIGFRDRASRIAFQAWILKRYKIRKKSDRKTAEAPGSPKDTYRGIGLIPLPRLP